MEARPSSSIELDMGPSSPCPGTAGLCWVTRRKTQTGDDEPVLLAPRPSRRTTMAPSHCSVRCNRLLTATERNGTRQEPGPPDLSPASHRSAPGFSSNQACDPATGPRPIGSVGFGLIRSNSPSARWHGWVWLGLLFLSSLRRPTKRLLSRAREAAESFVIGPYPCNFSQSTMRLTGWVATISSPSVAPSEQNTLAWTAN